MDSPPVPVGRERSIPFPASPAGYQHFSLTEQDQLTPLSYLPASNVPRGPPCKSYDQQSSCYCFRSCHFPPTSPVILRAVFPEFAIIN